MPEDEVLSIDRKEQAMMELLTPFQKEIVAALKEWGFRYKYSAVYQSRPDGDTINVSHIHTMLDLLRAIYRLGAQEKIWHIKKALEINC